MTTALRVLNIVYWIVLTVLLTVPNPDATVAPVALLAAVVCVLKPAAHLLGTAGLTLLGLAGRWPCSQRALLVLLVAYALLTELVQVVLPRRTPQLADVAQNLVGIALGLLLYRLWLALLPRLRSADSRS